MLIFIDTEFTDFIKPELISIGLISECGKFEFYAELPVNRKKCNAFVIKTVLPLLNRVDNAKCTLNQLTFNLVRWIEQFKNQKPVICFDYDGDWTLFCSAMGDEIPSYIKSKNIYPYLNELKLELFFNESKLNQHHALNDAKANRFVFTTESLPL